VASLKRTGSITVAVNLSPARESLLDSVSLSRILRLVATGTNTGVTVLGAGRLSRGFLVWALSANGLASKTKSASTIFLA
jgi:hypothetical protein